MRNLNTAQQSTRTHRLQSIRKSEGKESLKSSILIPSFNNSQDVSFQINNANNSSLFDSKNKEVRSSSHKKKLSVTAYFNQKKEEE